MGKSQVVILYKYFVCFLCKVPKIENSPRCGQQRGGKKEGVTPLFLMVYPIGHNGHSSDRVTELWGL